MNVKKIGYRGVHFRTCHIQNKHVLAASQRALGQIVRVSKFAFFCTLIILTGCAAVPEPSPGRSGTEHDALLLDEMATDLLSTLPQLLPPLSTTIQVNNAVSGNEGNVVKQLSALGYGIQRVDADQGKHFLRVESDTKRASGATPPLTELSITIGAVELSRYYYVVKATDALLEGQTAANPNEKTVIPGSALKIAGARQPIQLPQSQRELSIQNGERELIPASVEYAQLTPIESGLPTISLITSDVVALVAETATPGASLQGVNASRVEVNNRFYTTDSTFSSVLDNYNRVAREVVIFGNDSQQLGRTGKLTVRKLVGRFAAQSDVIGIVGCSNGPTKLEIGNEGLALGRAKRVTEELTAAGIPRDKVFDEGCWSPTTNAQDFPNRGVVIDLYRRKI